MVRRRSNGSSAPWSSTHLRPSLVTDDDRRSHEASVGAARLLGLRREKIIGRRLEDFAADETKAEIPDRWRNFLEAGEQAGTLRLLTPAGTARAIRYTAISNVLPVRHLLCLHAGEESWHLRQDASRFWANAIFASLKEDSGALQGFACVVRDFSDRREGNLKPRSGPALVLPAPSAPAIGGVVSGEFDRILRINDPLLEMVGYSREYVLGEQLSWLDLTPQEFSPLDELAHEECLRLGSCAPFKKSSSARTARVCPSR